MCGPRILWRLMACQPVGITLVSIHPHLGFPPVSQSLEYVCLMKSSVEITPFLDDRSNCISDVFKWKSSLWETKKPLCVRNSYILSFSGFCCTSMSLYKPKYQNSTWTTIRWTLHGYLTLISWEPHGSSARKIKYILVGKMLNMPISISKCNSLTLSLNNWTMTDGQDILEWLCLIS